MLLDTTGETSEIGWLTYPPGGVSAALAFCTHHPSLTLLPRVRILGRKPQVEANGMRLLASLCFACQFIFSLGGRDVPPNSLHPASPEQ